MVFFWIEDSLLAVEQCSDSIMSVHGIKHGLNIYNIVWDNLNFM